MIIGGEGIHWAAHTAGSGDGPLLIFGRGPSGIGQEGR